MVNGIVLAILVGFPAPATEAEPDGGSATLHPLVQEYFTARNPTERDSLAREIDAASDDSVTNVLNAIQHVDLWSAAGPAPERFSMKIPGARRLTLECAYPEGYDPSIAYPALLCMPDDDSSAVETLALARRVLGDSIREFVLVAPTQPVGGSFHLPDTSAGEFMAMVIELRRRIHIDTDRLFLFGAGAGGDAAWLTAMFHPEVPAGVIALASYPHVPYAAQTLPFLLPNLRRIPVLSVWPQPLAGEVSLRRVSEVAHNRALRRIARKAGLPFVGLEVANDRFADGVLPIDAARAILDGNRARLDAEAAIWFRYPEQGQVAWLRCTRFDGEVWDASELSIIPARGVDRDTFIVDAIQGKMGYLSGRIDGQRIEITARRCRRVELALPIDLIDFNRPITVRCNGKIRHKGILEPAITTLLESAHATWEFQRPAVARLSFSIKRQRKR